MAFLEKGLEYNKLAKAFNSIYLMLQQLISKIENEPIEVVELYLLAYIGRKEIIDRMDKYNWDLYGPIVIPMMPGYKKTLSYAYQQTIGKIEDISEQEYCSDEVQEILNKGEFYYELDRNIPDEMKK